MMDYEAFISGEKNFLSAPAGHGKTYTIAACLKKTTGLQLVLTHTHAGVSSLKDKVRSMGVPRGNFHIETISSYAQKYTKAFYRGTDIPDQSDETIYHNFMVDKACDILKLGPIGKVIQATYNGLFVDEYQDCSVRQHQMIMALSKWLPVHILGDQLQGIFGDLHQKQGSDSVNLPADLKENGFEIVDELNTPHRWHKNGNNRALGEALQRLRKDLLSGKPVNLVDYADDIEIHVVNEAEKFDRKKYYSKTLWSITNEKSVLVIEPEGTNVATRVAFARRYNQSFTVLEAIDHKDFYKIAASIDDGLVNKPFKYLRLKEDILFKLYKKKEINEWFGLDTIKSKREPNKAKAKSLKKTLEDFEMDCTVEKIHQFLSTLENGIGAKVIRHELFSSVLKSLETANVDKISVSEAMRNHRNNVRRAGRKYRDRVVGTTLLTKGLEFDVVAILDAHKITCPKKLYVAMTRACKRLIVFTKEKKLSLQ